MIQLKFDNAQVKSALRDLLSKTQDTRPLMQELGEHLAESTKQRFARSEGPDGEKWAANSDTTIGKHLGKTKGNYKKKGGLSAKGKRRKAGKKPLIGESKQLRNVHYRARKSELELGSRAIYAGVQQFGASKGAFGRTKRNGPIPWGDIPARPFLGFSDDDRSVILDTIRRYVNV